MSADRPDELRTWDTPDEADRLLEELRAKIDLLRAKVLVYRAVMNGDDETDSANPPAVQT